MISKLSIECEYVYKLSHYFSFCVDLSQLQQNQYSLHESTLQHLLSSIQSMQSVLTSPPTPVSAHFQAIVQQEIASLSQQ